MRILILEPHNSQKGMALITAIGFIAVLSILGTVVLTTATRDIQKAGGFLPARQAFYTADRAVEYAMNRDIIINLSPGDTLNLVGVNAKDATNADLDPAITHDTIIEGDSGNQLVSGTVADLGPHDLPPSMAVKHGNDFGANLYHVEVEATANSGAAASESRVNASIVRLFKMDDDTIFRTSGGG